MEADRHLEVLTKKFERALLRIKELEEEKTESYAQVEMLQVQLRTQLQQHQEDLQRARLQIESQARDRETVESSLRRANVPELMQRVAKSEEDLKLCLAKYQEATAVNSQVAEECAQFKQIIRQQERELMDARARLSLFEEQIAKLERGRKKAGEAYFSLKEQSAQLAGDLLEAQRALESKKSEEDRRDSKLKIQHDDFKSALRQKQQFETKLRALEYEQQKLVQETNTQREKLQIYRQRQAQLEKQVKSLQDVNERLKWENEAADAKLKSLEVALSGQPQGAEVLMDQKLRESEAKIVKLSEQLGPLVELTDRLSAELKDKTEEIRRLKDLNKSLNQTLLTRSKELGLLLESAESAPRDTEDSKNELEHGQVYSTANFLVSRRAKYLSSPYHVESPRAIAQIAPERLDLDKAYQKDLYLGTESEQ